TGFLLDRGGNGCSQIILRRNKRSAAVSPTDFMLRCMADNDCLCPSLQQLRIDGCRIAEIELRGGLTGNDVGDAGAGGKVRDLERKRRKGSIAGRPVGSGEFGED